MSFHPVYSLKFYQAEVYLKGEHVRFESPFWQQHQNFLIHQQNSGKEKVYQKPKFCIGT